MVSKPIIKRVRLKQLTKSEIEQRNLREDERIRQTKMADMRIRDILLAKELPAHNVSFNSVFEDHPLGAVYLERDSQLGDLTEEGRSFAEATALQVFQESFPELKIVRVTVAWDSFERIERDFGGSYDRYFMSQ